MHDQWIIYGPAFCFEESLNGAFVHRVRAETVDRFGRKGYEPAIPDYRSCLIDCFVCRVIRIEVNDLRH